MDWVLGTGRRRGSEPSTVEVAVVCTYWIAFALSGAMLRSWKMVACPLTQIVMFIIGINQFGPNTCWRFSGGAHCGGYQLPGNVP